MSTSTDQLPGLAQTFFEEVTKKHAPNASIVKKSSSRLMKTIGFVLKPFNPQFLHYTTTIGTTIYIPDHLFHEQEMLCLDVITHETQHIIDYVNNPALFIAGYLFPQCLALLSVLALFGFINPLMLLWLLALGFLAPIPAPWRYLFELRGYRVSNLLGKLVHHYSDAQLLQLTEHFKKEMTTGSYYYTWPFPSRIEKDMKEESFVTEPRYQEIIEFLKLHNRLF
jgi:hypothetical protein